MPLRPIRQLTLPGLPGLTSPASGGEPLTCAARLDPPRSVELLHDGQWVAGTQDPWVRSPDGEWRSSGAYSVVYEWGPGKHLRSLPAHPVRLRRG
jgi:hypothetical protein